MGSRFGWHSGDIHANNIQAGSFLVSGTIGQTTVTAIAFKNKFHNIPRLSIAQVLKTGVAADTSYGASVGALYETALSVSGSGVQISGVTIAGFTAQLTLGATDFMNETNAAASASGAIINYIAIDDVTR